MTLQKKNFADLYAQLESEARQRAPQLSDFQEGSVVRSLFESFAVELTVLYEQLELVYNAGFVDTAEGDHLDRVVAILGIKRNEPDFATGSVTFSRDAGSHEVLTIPIGTLVTTAEDPSQEPSKKAYLTTQEAQLPVGVTAVAVPVQAEAPGSQLTTAANTIVVMPRPTPGIKTVTNLAPVRFVGRERESDEELRQRAKQALLASGRASATALENALLSLPGIHQVRIKEDSSQPGVVYLYVDGLTADNEAQVRQRIDEVRAAGIYVVLEPAQSIPLTIILRIAVDPRIKGEERLALEERVVEAVEAFVRRIPMGEPLLFTQLTAAVLNVKGVVDLVDFTIAATHASADGTTTTHYTAQDRRIPAALQECFLPAIVRTAATTKPLPIDVLVQLGFPVTAVQAQRATAYEQQIAGVKAGLASSPGVQALAANVRAAVVDELSRFYDQVQQAVNSSDWRVRLDEPLQEAVVTTLQAYFTTLATDNRGQGGYVEASAIGAYLQQTALTPAEVAQAQTTLNQAWGAQFTTLNATLLTAFPSARLEEIIKNGAQTAYQSTVTAAQAQLTAALAALTTPDNNAQQAATAAFDQSVSSATAIRDASLGQSSAWVTALYQETEQNLQRMATSVSQPGLTAASLQSLYELLGISLRAVDLTGVIQAETPQIKVTFVEEPTPGLIFVYTDRLELEGAIRLLLPPTATRAEKERIKRGLRQAIEEYLARLYPAVAVDLEHLRALAATYCPVLFDPAALRLVQLPPQSQIRNPLPDRNTGKKLTVQWSEKVFLAADGQFTLEIEQ